MAELQALCRWGPSPDKVVGSLTAGYSSGSLCTRQPIIADDPEHLFMGGIDQALGTSDFPVAARKATQVKERTRRS